MSSNPRFSFWLGTSPEEEPRFEWSKWQNEHANPWKMRWSYSDDWNGEESDRREILSTVSNDGRWWGAVWDDLVSETSRIEMLRFWKSFATSHAAGNRMAAIVGVARVNWTEAFMVKKIGLGVFEVEVPEEARIASERFLGNWLAQVIQNGDHRQLRKLSDLVSGKNPPTDLDLSVTEKFQVLDAFASFLLKHFRLPTKTELSESVSTVRRGKGNFQNHARELGLIGLPGKMPRGA